MHITQQASVYSTADAIIFDCVSRGTIEIFKLIAHFCLGHFDLMDQVQWNGQNLMDCIRMLQLTWYRTQNTKHMKDAQLSMHKHWWVKWYEFDLFLLDCDRDHYSFLVCKNLSFLMAMYWNRGDGVFEYFFLSKKWIAFSVEITSINGASSTNLIILSFVCYSHTEIKLRNNADVPPIIVY